MDTQLVEKIVHEVKSQGVFDEFRKDSMADVDTKPAYQNLRQRVENTVKKFLSEQKWTPDTNKNQLREKLRRHITESGFLDVGVERIVDQVVNPKIGSVFQPRIEEIAYNYLGLPAPPKKYEPPPPPLMHPLPPLPLNGPPLKVETCSLLPTDLEQVSPDSDKATVTSEGGDDKTPIDMDTDDKMIDDEDESPPFEPLVKEEIKDEFDEMRLEKKDENIKIKMELESSLDSKKMMIEESNDASSIKVENLITDNDSQELSNFVPDTGTIDKEASQSLDARICQDSQLSSVSSDSRLSVNGKENSLQSSSQEAVAANISEEAQMPKFNENSSEPNAMNANGNNENCTKISELHFDIKKDEIKFEGTERKTGLETSEVSSLKTEDIKYSDLPEIPSEDIKTETFKFSSNHSNLEAKEDIERTPNALESSFGSSIDDSSTNTTPKACSENKEKEISLEEKSPLLQTPKQQQIPTTPSNTSIPTPPLPTPTATPSPLSSQKIDKDQSSRHSSSSSSKHKKHSKERRKSHDREKDKDRHRSSTKDSSSKYHSGSGSKSSKHSSSNNRSSSSSYNKSSNDKDLEKSSSSTHSSTKQSKHSHSSSSSNEHNDSKNSKRDSDRRHHSSSSSKSHKEHSSSSKRNERKDDHNEAKNKTQRRKSTDSNDDDGDKSLGGSGGKSSSQNKSNSSSTASKSTKSKTSNEVKSPKTNDSQKDDTHVIRDNEEIVPKTPYHNNVVILNDLLENPQIQFVQLDQTGHQVETPQEFKGLNLSIDKKECTEFNNNNELLPTKEETPILNSSMELLYFEDANKSEVQTRLQTLENTIDLYRTAVNCLRFDTITSDEGIVLSNEKDLNSENKSNLLTESLKRKLEVNYEEYEKTPRKRAASNANDEGQIKTSPTPSDNSVNSKENEEIDKNIDVAKKSLVDRHKAVQKLTQQQRYSSEDLYKPRPILGQRSRRRGMDSLI